MRTVFALVPVKDPELGKTRLASLLDGEARRRLNVRLALRTVLACAQAFGSDRTVVIGSAPEIVKLAGDAGARLVSEPDGNPGLNAALACGALFAQQAGADAIVVVPTDLVGVCPGALRAAAEALPPVPGCVLVPDRHGTGTNLLAVAPVHPEIFAFGERSLERHRRRALELGLAVRLHASRELALDLDLPEDYALWDSARAA